MFWRIFRTHESVVAATAVVLSLTIAAVNPAFLSVANLFDLLRNATIYGILALGVLVVLISGGVDVSFPAIAAASSYVALKILLAAQFEGPAWLAYGLALPIGVALGELNAFLISRFRLPTLIVTLGTASMCYGFVLFFVGNLTLYELPPGLARFGTASLWTAADPNAGTSSLHPSAFLLAAAALAVWVLLGHTMAGRGVYAMGGNREAAERCGFDVRRIEYLIYGLAGALASIAGVTQAALYRNANPAALMGTELDVIAAVVLGGAAIAGGRGTVAGTLLGLFLITVMKSGLILVGIPAEWQKVAIGLALIVGTTAPALRRRQVGRGGPTRPRGEGAGTGRPRPQST